MEEEEMLELYEVDYCDLVRLSSTNDSTSPPEELESMTRNIMETLGPKGPGLLAVTGVPNASKLRKELLPLARKLALLNHEDRKRILKEHNLGSDVPLKNPDRGVSSFAMKLNYVKAPGTAESKPSPTEDNQLSSEEDHPGVDRITRDHHDEEFKNLGNTFKELGFCMMELGLSLARMCDRAMGGQELERSLLESCTAKGRLIHYHSALDGLLLKEAERRNRTTKRQANSTRDHTWSMRNGKTPSAASKLYESSARDRLCGIHFNLWQQWHYDYGIFTVLTAPLFVLPSHSPATQTKYPFLVSSDVEWSPPSGHTYLQIYDPNRKDVLMVKVSPESFVIQVGESADIISMGKLQSTLHSVCRPAALENLSRETFVVFLQPAWSKTFCVSDYPQKDIFLNGQVLMPSNEEAHIGQDKYKLSQEIQKVVPPLSSRLKDGMTFAEFSRETTKQYYGGAGLQSNK